MVISASPAAATSGPTPMKKRGPYRSARAPKREDRVNMTSVTGTEAVPAATAL